MLYGNAWFNHGVLDMVVSETAMIGMAMHDIVPYNMRGKKVFKVHVLT